MKTIQIPATIEGVSTLKDGSMSIRLHSQEMSSEQKVTLMDYVQKFGWMLFKENTFKDEEIPTTDAQEGKKTLSERLRGVLYVYFQQYPPVDQSPLDFETFYRRQMEKLIELYKSKLN